jgi:hypothetical protein
MTDQEILKELDLELKNDLVMRLKRWAEKLCPEYKLEKLVYEKLAYLKSRGRNRRAVSIEGSDYIQIALDPIVYKTKLGNIFMIIPIAYLNMRFEVAFIRFGYFLKVPGKYKYLPEKSKKPVIRDGYHYFNIAFDYDYRHDGSGKYNKPKVQFIRITSHFLDRLAQRSTICQGIAREYEIGTIQIFCLLDEGTIPFSYSREEVYDFISQLSDEEIRECIPAENQMEAFSIKYDVTFIDFFDGCVVCTPGVENRRIIVLKTFLTKEQAEEYKEEMKFTSERRIAAVQKMIENECYY